MGERQRNVREGGRGKGGGVVQPIRTTDRYKIRPVIPTAKQRAGEWGWEGRELIRVLNVPFGSFVPECVGSDSGCVTVWIWVCYFSSPKCPILGRGMMIRWTGCCRVFWDLYELTGFSAGARGKEPALQPRRHKRWGSGPWVGKIPWRRAQQPLQCSCLENPMDTRSLASYSSWGGKESGMTEMT